MDPKKPKWMKEETPPPPPPEEKEKPAPKPRRKLRGARKSSPEKIKSVKPFTPIIQPPAQMAIIPPRVSMWLNDTYGCCVTSEEAFAKACHDPTYFIQDATVKTWAEKHGILNGAELLDVLNWMRAEGFSQDGKHYNDGDPTKVDFRNANTLKAAISMGPVKLGVAADQLDGVVGDENGWFGLHFGQDANEDHCVSASGYGPIGWLADQLGVDLPDGVDGSQFGILIFTWNTLGILDYQSLLAITGEAYLRTPTTKTVPPEPTPPMPPTPPTPPPAPPGADSFIVLGKDVKPGTYTLGVPDEGSLEKLRGQFAPSMTPQQWLALITALLQALMPILFPTPPAAVKK